jgi:hypothetical protein
MTTYQYTITLDDSEFIALENILNNAMSSQLADEDGKPEPNKEFFHPQHCESIYMKLRASQRDAVMTSTSSACK